MSTRPKRTRKQATSRPMAQGAANADEEEPRSTKTAKKAAGPTKAAALEECVAGDAAPPRPKQAIQNAAAKAAVTAVPSSRSVSDRCEAACYDAAFCGKGPEGAILLVDGASDINFQGVLKYLATAPAPPIDHRLIPDGGAPGQNCSFDFSNYSTVVFLDGQGDHDEARNAFRLSLLGAAVALEWDHFEDSKSAAKRAILELVLLAGATIDAGVRAFAGTSLGEPGGGVQYGDEYQSTVLDLCKGFDIILDHISRSSDQVPSPALPVPRRALCAAGRACLWDADWCCDLML